jgi:hypothetical protein
MLGWPVTTCTGCPTDVVDFLPFYEQRRSGIRGRLGTLLGAGPMRSGEQPPKAPDPSPLASPQAQAPELVTRQHTLKAAGDTSRLRKRSLQASLSDRISSGRLPAGPCCKGRTAASTTRSW